jgi:hypothetical protein
MSNQETNTYVRWVNYENAMGMAGYDELAGDDLRECLNGLLGQRLSTPLPGTQLEARAAVEALIAGDTPAWAEERYLPADEAAWEAEWRAARKPKVPVPADYRVKRIEASLCAGRALFDVDACKDKRWSKQVYYEYQCVRAPQAGNDLCRVCEARLERFAETGTFGAWNGRITEEPPAWTHMLGTEWAKGLTFKA